MNKQRKALEAAQKYFKIRNLGSNAEKVLSQIEAALAEPEQEPAKRLQWHLDSEASKFLADLILACEEPTEITLSVGLIQEDNGAIKHGLLVHETEMPEEGKSLLVECEPIGISPQPREWKELSDVEWMNIVNKDRAWCGYDPSDVAHEVFKLTSAALRAKNGL